MWENMSSYLIRLFVPKTSKKGQRYKEMLIFFKILVRKSSKIGKNVGNISLHLISPFIPKNVQNCPVKPKKGNFLVYSQKIL